MTPRLPMVCKQLFSQSGNISPTVYQQLYDSCRDDAVVTAYITDGGGHSWAADKQVMLKWPLLLTL